MRIASGKVHYGWVVAALTALTLLVAAGVRSAPGVFITPLEDDFGWSRSGISFAASIGLLIFGLVGPAVGVALDRLGARRLMTGAVLVMAASTAAGTTMSGLWELNLYWGLLSGISTGMVATVLGAAIANRWFVARRGLVIGLFGGATSAGQLVFVPLLVWIVDIAGWRGASLFLAACGVLLAVPIVLLMRDSPAAVGLEPYGGPLPTSEMGASPTTLTAGPGPVRRAMATPDFWLLCGSFFVCGATSTGLIGTHFLAHSHDSGIAKTTAASALALMGAMNFIGTIASGWLTDRYDPRYLLACYYVFRGVALFLLPAAIGTWSLAAFAVLFGLDYIATVPPTAALTADLFGRRHVAVLFGWIFCAHQVGAALAAYLGGVARDSLGDYQLAFLAAGTLAVAGGLMALRIAPITPLRLAASAA